MRTTKRWGIVISRYMMPIVIIIIVIALSYAPIYRYVTADTGVQQTITLAELASNSFETTREYLFGVDQKQEHLTAFSNAVLALVLSCATVFFAGVIYVAYSSAYSLKICMGREVTQKERALFLTLTPNRVVMCIYYAFLLLPFMIPHVVALCYDELLNYHVELITQPFDAFWLVCALYAVMCALVFASVPSERRLHVNIFSKRASWHHEKPEEQTDNASEEKQSELYDEQTQRILDLLIKENKQDENGED